jgi:hypothetical protein
MRASDEVSETQAAWGWATKLADEAEAWRSRRGQTPEMVRGRVRVVRLPKRSRSSVSDRGSADLLKT